jgi:hypothetical protein
LSYHTKPKIGRRKDGRFYPKGKGKALTHASYKEHDNSQKIGTTDTIKTAGKHALHHRRKASIMAGRGKAISRARKAELRTLENALLYRNFVNKLKKLNEDFDEDLIDKTLEVEEALFDLKKKHPELNIGLKAADKSAGFGDFLDEMGIANERIQNLVALEDNPLSEEELGQLSYVLNMRSEHAKKTDKALKAPVTKDLRKWTKNPEKVDIAGVDTPSKERQ